MSLAYIAKYTAAKSLGNDPEEDYRIGAIHNVVGCGLNIKKRDFQFFTIVNDNLIYNGPLGDKQEHNPWQDSGHTWHVYSVRYHHVLGPIDTVLAACGLDRSILPSSQCRWVKNPNIQKLIDYAISQV